MPDDDAEKDDSESLARSQTRALVPCVHTVIWMMRGMGRKAIIDQVAAVLIFSRFWMFVRMSGAVLKTR